MIGDGAVRSTCGLCYGGCGVLIHLKDGKVVKVEGDPELVKEYPLIFTSWESAPFRHSGGRQIVTLREMHLESMVNIHPEKAEKLGIQGGDQVYIETRRGRIKQKASLSTNLDPRVVGVDYGWWFPKKEASDLYGWTESNVNILTDDRPLYNREVGSTNLRGILCKVYKYSDEEQK